MAFGETEVEIGDNLYTNPENKVVNIPTAGTSVTVNRTDGKPITLVYLKNPNKGVNANDPVDVVYSTIDGQVPNTKGTTISRGEYVYFPGLIQSGNLKVDTNNNNTKVEIVLWG